ncbi:uncharacterized protein (TIGR02271 family) [Palleronia aestuarii]|uniref:Uncharacterized protein (TIGR02271 family) n=1 Tax=Palleronia aestuarii TaxID=568105 RepID=A0A2W7N7H1_9RHOB|nr:YsnF/AvaK domain-containing protein [Palleronia aestuarii]PZX14197.1 uncharacterized protein (TIGR02271 family) [Palleronia aestuarii]
MSDYNATQHDQYVTAFFDSQSDADAAVERIVAEGVSRSDIRVVAGDDTAKETSYKEDKGFFEALGDFFMPDEDRHAYAEGLSRGGYLVSLNTTDANRDRILDILDDEGTVDMDAREESWRSEGWEGRQTGYEQPAMATGGAETPLMSDEIAGETAYRPDGASGEMVDGTIDVVEEKLRVGKRQMDHGRVRVRSYIVETPVEEQVSLREENVHVERRPVDRALSDGEAAFAEQTLEATETDEVAVVSKEARVVEEITLNKDVEEHTETVSDTVRHTEVEIEDDRTDRTEPTR